jgi:mannosyltransferase
VTLREGRVSPARREALLVALCTAAVLAALTAGLGTASFWYDEAATVSGATRSLQDLGRMAGHVDAVHAAYYAFMHLAAAFGPSEWAMRLPSALAVTGTAVALYGIVRHVERPAVAASAALLFLALPRTLWMSGEARSFALATLLITLCSLLLVRALTRSAVWPVVVYPLAATLAVWVFMYNALVVLAHGITVVLVRRDRRGMLLLTGMPAAAALSAPVILEAVAQRGQLGGIAEIGSATLEAVLSRQFFMGYVPALAALAALAAAALLTLGIRPFRRRPPLLRASPSRPLLALSVLWAVVPTASVLIISATGESIYQPRAQSISLPAVAILLVLVLRRALTARVLVVASLVTAAVSVPFLVSDRSPESKGTGWQHAAQTLAGLEPRPDAVLFLPPTSVHSFSGLIPMLYPESIAGMDDLTLGEDRVSTAELFDARSSVAKGLEDLTGLDRIAVVGDTELPPAEFTDPSRILREAGFSPSTRIADGTTWIQLYTR